MAIEITIPRLGWNMEEGVFIGWLKQDGDAVKAGDRLFTLEGEKATEDIECLDSGILRIPENAPKPGDTVVVGAVIGYLVAAGESVGWVESSRPSVGSAVGLEDSTHPTTNRAPTAGLEDSPHPAADKAASPRARRVARELGIDWTKISGSGKTGRIRERDIRAAAAQSSNNRNPNAVPLTARRQMIAARLQGVAHSTAAVTLTTTADASNLVNLRRQFKATEETAPTYTDFLAKLAAAALISHPHLNAGWADDQLVVNKDIHIGIAVDAEAGLLVPVLRNVPHTALRQLAADSRDLVARARAGKLKADEMQGGTFTITNLGNYGIDAFTPIINPPQCAILGVGRIQRQPVASGDAIIIRDVITLSLTFDHRIVDGAPAARFLQTLVQLIENPAPALVM
jgi:pyruvate dehydrogenase E2 component (dihydrolipoamide acetyltransferase)